MDGHYVHEQVAQPHMHRSSLCSKHKPLHVEKLLATLVDRKGTVTALRRVGSPDAVDQLQESVHRLGAEQGEAQFRPEKAFDNLPA